MTAAAGVQTATATTTDIIAATSSTAACVDAQAVTQADDSKDDEGKPLSRM